MTIKRERERERGDRWRFENDSAKVKNYLKILLEKVVNVEKMFHLSFLSSHPVWKDSSFNVSLSIFIFEFKKDSKVWIALKVETNIFTFVNDGILGLPNVRGLFTKILSKYFNIQFFHIIYNQAKLAIIAISFGLSLFPFKATLTSKLLIISIDR